VHQVGKQDYILNLSVSYSGRYVEHPETLGICFVLLPIRTVATAVKALCNTGIEFRDAIRILIPIYLSYT